MLQRRRARVQVGVRGKEAALTRGQRRSHSVFASRFSAIKLASSDVSDSISLSQAVYIYIYPHTHTYTHTHTQTHTHTHTHTHTKDSKSSTRTVLNFQHTTLGRAVTITRSRQIILSDDRQLVVKLGSNKTHWSPPHEKIYTVHKCWMVRKARTQRKRERTSM